VTTAETLQDEATAAPPLALCLTAGLGLAFPERDYLVWDPFDGERDTGIRCQQTTLRRAIKRHTCFGLLGEQNHEIQPGDMYRHEKGFADGRWGCYRLCIGCMDKWLTEIGRTPASPNVRVQPDPTAHRSNDEH
jgi:hypothetical protein